MAVTLGTDWKKVCEASYQVTSNTKGYVRLYMKYDNRSGLNDTIYYEIRQFAYNPYGTYLAWEWQTAIAWSIKSGNTTKASGSFTQSAIYSYKTDSTSNEVVRASGSYVQAHNSDGTFSDTLTLTAPIYTQTKTATGDIVLPAIAINPTLTINSSTNLTSNGTTITYTLGNTNGRTIKVQYSLNNSTWLDWRTNGSDGQYSYNLLIPLSNFPSTYTPTIYFRAITGNNSSGSKSKQLTIDPSIKVSISSVTVSAVNSINALGNLFVQNLSQARIQTSATAGEGASISSYDLTALGGVSNFTAKTNIGNNYTYPNILNESGNNKTATVKVTDTRGSASTVSQPSTSFNIIPYSNPSIQNPKVERCNQDGTLNNNGTYCKLTVTYNIAPINDGSSNHNTKKLYYRVYSNSSWSNWTEISLSSYSYNATISQVISGTYAVSNSFPIEIKIEDISTSVTQSLTLPTSFVLVSKRAGGKGITFGGIAESDEFHNYMETNLHQTLNMVVDSTVIPIFEIVDE